MRYGYICEAAETMRDLPCIGRDGSYNDAFHDECIPEEKRSEAAAAFDALMGWKHIPWGDDAEGSSSPSMGNDLHSDNVGIYDGRVVILDFGVESTGDW